MRHSAGSYRRCFLVVIQLAGQNDDAGMRIEGIFNFLHDAFGSLTEVQQPVKINASKDWCSSAASYGVRRLKGLGLDAVAAGDLLQQFENITVIVQDRDTRSRRKSILLTLYSGASAACSRLVLMMKDRLFCRRRFRRCLLAWPGARRPQCCSACECCS